MLMIKRLLIACIIIGGVLYAQEQKLDEQSKRGSVSSNEIASTLSEPKGLHKLALRIDHFKLPIRDQPAVYRTLATLTKFSAVIVYGEVSNTEARLVSDGNLVVTNCKFRPLEVIKGTPPLD